MLEPIVHSPENT